MTSYRFCFSLLEDKVIAEEFLQEDIFSIKVI